jgi:hypothetical protein
MTICAKSFLALFQNIIFAPPYSKGEYKTPAFANVILFGSFAAHSQ